MSTNFIKEPIKVGRAYKKWSLSKLLRFKSFLFLTRFNFFVKNMRKIYFTSCKIFGSSFVNTVIDKVYGDLFIGGSDTKSLQVSLLSLKLQGFTSIADFALEFLEDDKEHTVPQIVQSFIESIDAAVEIDNQNMIAIKVSSLAPISYTKQINKLQHALKILENAYYYNLDYEKVHADLFVYGLMNICNINKVNYKTYLKNIHDLFSSLDNKSDKFKYNIFELICKSKNNHDLISTLRGFFKLDYNTIYYLVTRSQRLENDLMTIFNHAKSKNSSVMIDAEQTYIQTTIDYIAVYLMKELNVNKDCTVINTLQMYLKNSLFCLKDYFAFCIDNKLNLGIKYVRGAYMVEERKLAKMKKYPDPICSNQAETDYNYNSAVNISLQNTTPSDKIIFATHNYDSISYIHYLIDKKDVDKPQTFQVAQLVGIGEHSTWLSKEKLVSYLIIKYYFYYRNLKQLNTFLMVILIFFSRIYLEELRSLV